LRAERHSGRIVATEECVEIAHFLLHLEHFQRLVAVVVDELHGDLPLCVLGERARVDDFF
jgi:hypothetical protein